MGLRDETVLGVDRGSGSPLRSASTLGILDPWIHRSIAIPEGSVARVRRRYIKVGHAAEVTIGDEAVIC